MVFESRKRPGGYYINGKFVLAENWEISKEDFTEAEQQEFLEYVIAQLVQKVRSDIQKQLDACYINYKNYIENDNNNSK